MKKQVQDTTLVRDWHELPASRRHLYFYILLLLLMLLAENLRGPRGGRQAMTTTELPPPVPASQVYPAPVTP